MNYLENLNSDILLVGGYPPPYGGITIHIQRLLDKCLAAKITTQVVSQFSTRTDGAVIGIKANVILQIFRLLRIVINYEGKIIHFHTSNLKRFLYIAFPLILFARNKKIILTAHSGKFATTKGIRRLFIKMFLTQISYIIAINEYQVNFFLELGEEREKIKLIPSFIPPPKYLVNDEFQHNNQILDLKEKTDVLLLMSGYAKPHYGYDIALEVINNFKGCSLGVIFVFYTEDDISYKRNLIKRIQLNKNNLVLENLNTEQFLTVLSNIDIYVRPNEIDSYGMVIAEALSLGKIVIASDVCPRHPGTNIFKTGDVQNFSLILENVINNIETERDLAKKVKIVDYSKDLIQLYNGLLLKN